MYVDGFVIPVRKKQLRIYKKMAEIGKKVWKKHGALDYKECVADDFRNKWGISFSKLAKKKSSETIVFSYIVFKSKAHRNQVNAKVMKDPELKCCGEMTMPFDMKRMAYGGFKVFVGTGLK